MNIHEGNGKTCLVSYIVGLDTLNDIKLHMPSYCAWYMYVGPYKEWSGVTCQAQPEKNSGNQNVVVGMSAKSTFEILQIY